MGISVILSSLSREDKGQLGVLDMSAEPSKYPCTMSCNDIKFLTCSNQDWALLILSSNISSQENDGKMEVILTESLKNNSFGL